MHKNKIIIALALLTALGGSSWGFWKAMDLNQPIKDSEKTFLYSGILFNSCETCAVQKFDAEGGTYVLPEGDFKVELLVPSKEELEKIDFLQQKMAVTVLGIDGNPIPFINDEGGEPRETLEVELNQSVGFQNMVGGPQREIILAGTGGSALPLQAGINDHYQIYQVLPDGVYKVADLVTRREVWASSQVQNPEEITPQNTAEPFSAKVRAGKADGLPALFYTTSLGNVTLKWNGKKFVDSTGKLRNLGIPGLL
ncbi:MAG: hypothetical protein H7333_00645 [Bdellovibrionales bacterium]|nr:hypothetical protein [Oligoflexia bacterium]